MIRFRPTLALSVCAAVLAACGEIPVLPQWDADWYVPLPSQNLSFRDIAGGLPSIPNGASYAFNYTVTQPVDDAMAQVLKQDLRAASVILTLRKTIDLFTTDTLLIANSAAGLNAGNPSAIVLPLALVTADRTVVDTITVSGAALAMLKNLGENGGTLNIRLSGRAGNNSGGPVAVATTDSLGARIAVVVRVPASR